MPSHVEVRFKFTRELSQRLKKAAQDDRRKPTDWVRVLITDELDRRATLSRGLGSPADDATASTP